jgi:hypothetical protein
MEGRADNNDNLKDRMRKKNKYSKALHRIADKPDSR